MGKLYSKENKKKRRIEIIDKKIEKYRKLQIYWFLFLILWCVSTTLLNIFYLRSLGSSLYSLLLYLIIFLPGILLYNTLWSYYHKKEKMYKTQREGIPIKFQFNLHERTMRKLFKKDYRKQRRKHYGIKFSFLHKKCSNCLALGGLNPSDSEGWSFCNKCDGTGLKLRKVKDMEAK